MPIEWISALKGPIWSTVTGIWRRGCDWFKQRDAREASLRGEDLTTKHSLEGLVKAEISKLATLGADNYPTNVQPAAFRNWLRHDGNLSAFIDVMIAHAAQRPELAGAAAERLTQDYERLTHGAQTSFANQVNFVASFVIGQLDATEQGRAALSQALTRRLASDGVVPSADDALPGARIARMRLFAAALVESGKRSWKMPRFVAPLTLEAHEESKEDVRPTTPAELVTLIAKGAPVLLYGEGGIGKTTFTLELAEQYLRSGPRIPIFVDAAAWARTNLSLLQYLVGRPVAQSYAITVADLTTLTTAGQLILLINGWNEMSAASKLSCREDLIQLMVTAPALGLVTATRTPGDAPGLPQTKKVQVRGLTWKGQSAIIRSELDATQAADLIAVLAKNSLLRHAARSPLILRGVIAKARTGITPEATVNDLLGASVDAFEADAQRSLVLATAPLDGHHRLFLGALARSLTDQAVTSCGKGDAAKMITEVSQQLVKEGLYSGAPGSAAVLDILVNHHLLHIQDESVRFAHQRFQEYFAAQWLWHACFEDYDSVRLARAINAPAWSEVLFMIAERLNTQPAAAALRTRLVASATVIDLGAACDLAGACGFTSPDAPALYDSLVAQANAFSASAQLPVRTLGTMYQVASGFPEFAPALWQLLESPDQQMRLRVAEMGISVQQLGNGARERIATWPAARRAELVHDIGSNGQNYDFLVDLAYNEPDDAVRAAAIASLFWHFPASEEPAKTWLAAPLKIQTDRNVMSHIRAALDEDHLPKEILDRMRQIALSDGSSGTQIALALASPENVTVAGLDAIFEVLARNDHYSDTADILQIAKTHAPDRLLNLAIAAALEVPQRAEWVREILNSASADTKHGVVEKAWIRVQGTEFRKVNGEFVGPLANRTEISQAIDLSMKWALAPRGSLTATDYDHQRVLHGILAHMNAADLLAEVLSRGPNSCYAESAHLLELILIRIGRESSDRPREDAWMPTLDEVRKLISLFARKEDPADIPTVTVPVHLARIASHVAPAAFSEFILETCRNYLDAWGIYEERIQAWDRRHPEKRPNNPQWHSSLLSVLGRWGPDALPGLLKLIEHAAADTFIPEAIGRVAGVPWSANDKAFHRRVSADIREGNTRRRSGRMLRQPDDSFQHWTDEAARVLSRRLLELLSAFQGPPAPGQRYPRASEYRIGKLATLVAHLPSPTVLEPVSRAIASGLMNLYAETACIRALVRQGARLVDTDAIAQFEASYVKATAPRWVDPSTTYMLEEASQLLVCAIPAAALPHPVSHYVTLWQKLASSREVIRELGNTHDDACWSVFIEATDAVSSDGDAAAEIAMAVTSLLSSEVLPKFLALIEDGIFFRWCRDDWTLKRIVPEIVNAFRDSPSHIGALLAACRNSAAALADVLAGRVLREIPDTECELVAFLLSELDAGKISYRISPACELLIDLFKLEVSLGENQFEITMQSNNELRKQLYARAKGAGPVAITSKNILARVERSRRHSERPIDEPRHPAIEDGQAWTNVLSS